LVVGQVVGNQFQKFVIWDGVRLMNAGVQVHIMLEIFIS